MSTERIFGDSFNGDLEAILQWVHAQYKDRLTGENIRFYDFSMYDELEWRMPKLWAKRYVGPVMPPAHKIDGMHFSMLSTKSHRVVSRHWDGVWEFPEYNVLLIHVSQLREPDGDIVRPLSFVMADDEADLRAFDRYIDRQAQRYRLRNRVIVTLGASTPSMGNKVDPDDVILPAGMRDQLVEDAKNFIGGRRWCEENGVTWKRSVLLYGPPGTGKTTIAKLLASIFLDARREVYALVIDKKTDFADLRHAFSLSSGAKPSLLILEDLDAVQQSNIGRSALLNLLDGVTNIRDGVFLIGTTNFPHLLDPALTNRAGRWDRIVEVGLPSANARRAYVARKWRSASLEHLIPTVVAETHGLSLAALNEVRYQLLMLVRDGLTPTETDVRRIARELRNVARMTTSGEWGRDAEERRVGFAPSPSPWDGADATPLNAGDD